MTAEIHAIILAGGSGTRFWPASRKALPKQLLAIGPDDRSLISATVNRIAPLVPPERVLVATGQHLLDKTREALPGLPSSSFLGEPLAKNTAPCIAWATNIACQRNPDALIMVLPSDQHISDSEAYIAAVEQALVSAKSGVITTIGCKPTRPETGYGYIEVGAKLTGHTHRVVRFVEKPDRARAEEYLRSGRYTWNSGMFFFRGRDLLEAVNQHAPEISNGLAQLTLAIQKDPSQKLVATRRVFESFPSISIDYAVMEKAKELNVVVADFGWSDLGSWHAAWELAQKDEHGNAIDIGNLVIDGHNNLVRDLRKDQQARIIALVGVDDLCVIETDDALLVISKDKAQDVRQVVETLKSGPQNAFS